MMLQTKATATWDRVFETNFLRSSEATQAVDLAVSDSLPAHQAVDLITRMHVLVFRLGHVALGAILGFEKILERVKTTQS